MPATATAQSQIFSSDINDSAFFNPIKGRTFNPTPRYIQSRRDLTIGTRAVYGYLASCYGREGQIFPKVKTIAAGAGVSYSTATRAIFSLKQKKLLRTIPTGRASRYIFLDPDQAENLIHNSVDQPPVDQFDQPKMTEPVNQNERSGHSFCSEQAEPTPLYKKKPSKEKTTTAPSVVSLDDRKKQKALEAVPEKYRTPSVERVVNEGLSRGLDYVLLAVKYTNAHSSTNYGGYLARTIKENYAEGWTPPAVIQQRQQADILETEASVKAEAQKAVTAVENRATLAGDWLKLPESDRAGIRAEYLNQCNRFQLKKARLLDDDRLAQSIGFRLFLEAK